jgi:signal transduction histidine kinase
VEKAREQIGDDVVIDLREDATLTCDPVLITQVLVNLFENARKYGDDAKVVIDAREIDGGVAMTVRNSVENTFKVDQTVFAPFRRLVTEGGGDGLGLAIVERIVHLHDGSVSASCSDNTFTVELLLANQVEQ